METIKIKGIDEEIYFAKSDDGLPIYVWCNPYANSFYISLNVKYGSIHTEFSINNKKYKVPDGIAHFMEHIKFNVKKGATANDLFDPLGSDINAFTTFRYTSYLVYGTSKLKENISNLLDFVYNPYFTREMITKERGIIASEINMGYDQPYNRLFYEFYKSIFEHKKFRNYVSGEVDDIKKITLEDIKLIYNTFYHPENMFLIVTGNVNPYEILKIVNSNLKKKSFPKYLNPEIIEAKEPKHVYQKYKEIPFNVEVAKAKVGLKIPRSDFLDDDVKLNIILQIILNSNFGETSELKEELLQLGLITYMDTSRIVMDDYVLIDVMIESNYVDEVVTRIENTFNNLVMNQEDLTRKLNSSIATLVTNYESSEQVNSMLQSYLIYYDSIVPNVKEIFESIYLTDVLNVIKKISTKEMVIVKMDKDGN